MLAEQAHERVNEMAAQLIHRAAGDLTEGAARFAGEVGVDDAAHEIDIAEPAFARSFERGVDAGVEAPHITHLHEHLLVAGQTEQFSELGERHARRLLEVDVFAREQRGFRQPGTILRIGLHGDDLAGGEDLRLRKDLRPELRCRRPRLRVRLGNPDALPVRRFQRELHLGQPVRMAAPEETNAHATRFGSKRWQGSGGKGGGLKEDAAVHGVEFCGMRRDAQAPRSRAPRSVSEPRGRC